MAVLGNIKNDVTLQLRVIASLSEKYFSRKRIMIMMLSVIIALFSLILIT